LLHLVTGRWSLSTDDTADNTWKQVKADNEVMDTVGQALQDHIIATRQTGNGLLWEQVASIFTSCINHYCGQQCKQMIAVMECLLHPSQLQAIQLLKFFWSYI
jgi:hypothetical protein